MVRRGPSRTDNNEELRKSRVRHEDSINVSFANGNQVRELVGENKEFIITMFLLRNYSNTDLLVSFVNLV